MNAAPGADVDLVQVAASGARTGVTLWNSPAGRVEAGGDWCDAVRLSDECIALTIGDVAGHGSAVAETMRAMRASISHAVRYVHGPANVLSIANGVAVEHGGAIVTAVVAFFNQRSRVLTFANAGHPPPLLMTRERHEFLTDGEADLPLGIFRHHEARDRHVTLPLDALVAFYTDGITEHDRDPIRGETNLAVAARLAYGRPMGNTARNVARHVFRGGRGTDDAAALVLRTTPARYGSLERHREVSQHDGEYRTASHERSIAAQ